MLLTQLRIRARSLPGGPELRGFAAVASATSLHTIKGLHRAFRTGTLLGADGRRDAGVGKIAKVKPPRAHPPPPREREPPAPLLARACQTLLGAGRARRAWSMSLGGRRQADAAPARRGSALQGHGAYAGYGKRNLRPGPMPAGHRALRQSRQ